MTAENSNGRHGMQNPGDLRVPEGVEILPKQKTLVVNNGAVLVERDNYDQVVRLNGSDFTEEDEEQALKETTMP